MVLVRYRRAQQCEDAIAGGLHDIAFRSRPAWLILLVTGLLCLGAWLGSTQQPQAVEAPEIAGSEDHDNPLERSRFNAALRAGPHGIPALARTRAFAQIQAMPEISTSAGTWTFVGPDSLTNGQACTATGAYGNPALGCPAPNRVVVSGRVSALAFGAEGIYVGAASGGVWKSTNGGGVWAPLTDKEVTLAVGALAVVPGPPDIIYVGTGEGNNSCDSEFGQGILKSIDGGKTWTQLAAATFDRLTFTKLAVDAANPAVLYGGTTWGFNVGCGIPMFFRQHRQVRTLQIYRRRSYLGSEIGRRRSACRRRGAGHVWGRLLRYAACSRVSKRQFAILSPVLGGFSNPQERLSLTLPETYKGLVSQ